MIVRQHYFNTQRVENEFDCSGRGLHTTTPLVVKLELAYLTATDDKPPQKTKKSSKGAASDDDIVQHPGNKRKREIKRGPKNHREENRSNDTKDDNSVDGAVSPKVQANSRIKGRVKIEEVNRLARNAEILLTQVSVEKIEMVHRFRQQPDSYEASHKGKIPHISPHVYAVLNTGNALQFTEDNEERKLAKEYQEKKNKTMKQKKKAGQPSSSFSTSTSVFFPLSHGIDKQQVEDRKNDESPVDDDSPSTSTGDAHVTIPIDTRGGDEEDEKESVSNKEDGKEIGESGRERESVKEVDNKYEGDDILSQGGDTFVVRKDTDSIMSNEKSLNVETFYDNDSFAADSTSIATRISEKQLCEGGMQDNYSDASWEDDDNGTLDGRNSRLCRTETEREYSYSPDPDFSDEDERKSLISSGSGKQKGQEKDNEIFHGDCRRGSNASSGTVEYIRTESVVSLAELVRATTIKEEKV